MLKEKLLKHAVLWIYVTEELSENVIKRSFLTTFTKNSKKFARIERVLKRINGKKAIFNLKMVQL